MRRQATDWEKIFAKDSSDKELLPRMNKELLKLNNEKVNNPVEKRAKDLNRHLTKEEMQMSSKPMKRFAVSYVIREMPLYLLE